jgi:hypothetical protein
LFQFVASDHSATAYLFPEVISQFSDLTSRLVEVPFTARVLNTPVEPTCDPIPYGPVPATL